MTGCAPSACRRASRGTTAAACAVALVVATGGALPARADEPGGARAGDSRDASAASATTGGDRWAPVAGALALLLPLVGGSLLWSRDDRPDLQHRGVYLTTGG